MRVGNKHSLFGLLVCGWLLSSCDSPVQWISGDLPNGPPQDSLLTYYRTEHFVFFYDAVAYVKSQVIANGKVKEAHLKRIESELGVQFRGEIMVRLIQSTQGNWSGEAFPEKPYLIQETRSYFQIDPGHEVAHVVSFETMGIPKYRFLVEGLAVAHELFSQPKWTRDCVDLMRGESLLNDLQAVTEITASEQVNYPLAGAFVEWLEEAYGVEEFKSFYRDLSTFSYSGFESICQRDLGIPSDSLYQRFITNRTGLAKGSKYCANY